MSLSFIRAILVPSKGIQSVLERGPFSPMTVHSRARSVKKRPGQGELSTSTSRSSDGSPGDGVPDDKHTRTVRVTAPSGRVDAVLKSALGLSRNKIEQVFYENKIRINGEKVQKKGVHLRRGDEVDVVKGATDAGLLTVARVEVLQVEPGEDNVTVKLRRCKSLLVENYSGSNAWKERG